MQDEIIDRLIDLENDVIYQQYANEHEPEYLYVSGILPILVSAPHGAVHTRNGNKEEDEYTAGLARLVASRTGAHAIYARRKSRTDPNADFAAPYKKNLQQIVQENRINFVLDLHGARASRDFGVAIGTILGKSCSEKEKLIIIDAFKKHGILEEGTNLSRLDVDQQLPAEGDIDREPITRFCQRISVPAAQIEINAKLRIPIRRNDATHQDIPFFGDYVLIKNLIDALVDLTTSLAKR